MGLREGEEARNLESRSYKTFADSECNIDYGKVLLEIYDTVMAFEGGRVTCDPLKYINFFNSLPNDFGCTYDFLDHSLLYYGDMPTYEKMISDISEYLSSSAESYNHKYEFRIKRTYGFMWVRAHVVAVCGYSAVLCFKDIDKEKRVALLSEERTRRDPGTDLYNRKAAKEEVAKMMRSDKRGALMMIDIDNLKGINDEYGHLQGDLAIREVAAIVNHYAGHCLPYKSAIGRLGGDEFVAYISDCDRDIAIELAKRMLLAVRNDRVGELRTRVSLSIGIATLEDCERKEFDELFNFADMACNIVKISGKNTYSCYDKSMGKSVEPQALRCKSAKNTSIYKTTLEEIGDMFSAPVAFDEKLTRLIALIGNEFSLDRTYAMIFKEPVIRTASEEDYRNASSKLLCKWYSGGVFQNEADTVAFLSSEVYIRSFSGLMLTYHSEFCSSSFPYEVGNFFERANVTNAVHTLILDEDYVLGTIAFESLTSFNTDAVTFLSKAIAKSSSAMLKLIANQTA